MFANGMLRARVNKKIIAPETKTVKEAGGSSRGQDEEASWRLLMAFRELSG